MIVRIDRERCCSSGMCVLTAPAIFDQSEEDGSVRLLRRPRADDEEAVRDAVEFCPSQAIGIARE